MPQNSNPGPDQFSEFVGHAIVGIAALYVGHKMFGNAAGGIAVAALGIFAHAAMDQPVALILSDAGL